MRWLELLFDARKLTLGMIESSMFQRCKARPKLLEIPIWLRVAVVDCTVKASLAIVNNCDLTRVVVHAWPPTSHTG